MCFSNLLFYQDLPHSNKKKLDNFGTSRFHLKPAVHVERDLDLSQVNIVMINNNLFFQEASVRWVQKVSHGWRKKGKKIILHSSYGLCLLLFAWKMQKKIGLFCRIPFFEVEEAEQSAFEQLLYQWDFSSL